MISFASDYVQGAHPIILDKLVETNFEYLSGYGTDKYCEEAKRKILDICGIKNGEVEFLVGGTQTNSIVISTMLKPFEGVISAETGHISVHEAGAIEYSGYKVLTVPQNMGKINPLDVEKLLLKFYSDEAREHMVYPGMVYISNPTEYGTIYTKEELRAIHDLCLKYNIPLFIDGARLGYALESEESDLSIKDIASLCEVFYIGGTKVGALCGEAVVFTNGNRPEHFTNLIKKRGALIAKGRLLGIQFLTLFSDNLYFEISKNAIRMANKLKEVFIRHGIDFFIDSPTNQQFVILRNDQIEKLKKKVGFEFWETYDNDRTVVRFATSWATTEENIKELDNILKECL